MQDKKSDLDRTIYKLYAYFDVYTDTALSEKMSISRSAISQWRYKGVIPKKILSKYDKIISGGKEEIVVEAETIHIEKGEQKVDANYIIGLQKEKIEYQKEEINRLNAILQKKQEVKNKPAFHFKTKCEFDPETKTFGNNTVTGDTSMTGYTEEELSNLTSEEWALMYHPDSLEILLASIPDDIPDYTHNKWKHIYWKSKDGSYRMYNIESYHDKNEGVVRAYYYWVNGDIEGKS